MKVGEMISELLSKVDTDDLESEVLSIGTWSGIDSPCDYTIRIRSGNEIKEINIGEKETKVADKEYEFELNMSKEYQKKEVWDEWGMAYVFGDKFGAEYNYYVDVNYKQDGTEERIDASAIYLMWEEDNGFWETDVDCFEHYEIEWDKEDWAERLKNKMIEFVKEKKNENL